LEIRFGLDDIAVTNPVPKSIVSHPISRLRKDGKKGNPVEAENTLVPQRRCPEIANVLT
jgi:hypothetical protein